MSQKRNKSLKGTETKFRFQWVIRAVRQSCEHYKHQTWKRDQGAKSKRQGD